MAITMNLSIEMDRPIEKNKHYISPGGYDFIFDGKTHITFDFNESAGYIDEKNNAVILFEMHQFDTDYANISIDSFIDYLKNHNLTDIEDLYIHTGEYDDAEINVKRILDISFNDDSFTYVVPKSIINAHNQTRATV